MVKHSSVTYLVALALLGCLVEGQSYVGSTWSKSQEPRYPSPKVPQTPMIPPKLPTQPQPQPTPTCEVEESLKIKCGCARAASSPEMCSAISCCHDGRQCYYGKAVTVQCTKNARFVVVVARDATLPTIDLESITLLGEGEGCTHVDSNSGFAIYEFPVTGCGSIVKEEPGVIIYENRMSSSYEVAKGPLGAITRDSTYELLFQCRYIGTSVETLVIEAQTGQSEPLPVSAAGPLHVQLRLGKGVCRTKGCDEVDVAYTSYYTEADYPVTKVLRDPVYVEVRLLDKTDPNLVLNLGHCWATTTPNPHSLPKWDLLIDGCPYRDDRYLSSLVSVGSSSGLEFPNHYKRFIFQMFTFVEEITMVPLKEEVYIHCSTDVCSPGPGISCEQPCYRSKRAVPDETLTTPKPKIVTSSLPVVMVSPDE